MSLTRGVQVGAYEVLSLLGAGGMGEVYRARDPRLERDVAIKVLPEAFSHDPDRLRASSRRRARHWTLARHWRCSPRISLSGPRRSSGMPAHPTASVS